MFGRYVGKIGACGGLTLLQRAMGILRLPGITAHMYSPGAGNFLLSDGSTGPTTVDGVAGLVLDQMGTMGPELNANPGPFTAETGYELIGVSPSFNAGNLVITNTAAGVGQARYSVAMAAGKTYLVSTVFKSGAGNAVENSARMAFQVGADIVQWGYVSANGVEQSMSGYVCSPTDTDLLVSLQIASGGAAGGAGDSASASLISIKEVTGIPVLQPTTAYKPIKRRGLLNLLKWSTDWANAVWNKVTAPTDEAFQIISGIPAGTAVTLSCKLSGSGTIKLGYYAGALGVLDDTITLTSTPTRYSKTITTAAAEDLYVYPFASRGDPISTGLVATDPQLEYGATVNEYLPTTSAPASNPDAGHYWWEFDGSNDKMARTAVPYQMAEDHFAVVCFRLDAATAGQGVFFGGSGAGFIASIIADAAGGARIWYYNDATTSFNLVVGPAAVGEVMVVGLRCLNGVVTGWKNNVAAGTITPTGTFTLSTSGFGSHPFFVPFKGGLFHVEDGKGPLSDDQMATLMKEVGKRGGLTL